MQGSLNKMAPASRQWRQAADWARELAHLVDTMQTWLARQLSSTSLPFQKVLHPAFPVRHCTLPRCIKLFLCQVWPMEAVGDKAVFQFRNAAINLSSSCCQQQ